MSTQVSLELDRKDELLAGASGYMDRHYNGQAISYAVPENNFRSTQDLASAESISADLDRNVRAPGSRDESTFTQPGFEFAAKEFDTPNEQIVHLKLNFSDAPHTPILPLFDHSANYIDFNNVSAGSYISGTQYNARNGDDVVFLGNNLQEQIEAGLSLSDHWFSGGLGNDEIHGGTSNELISGDWGNDIISGGGGDDDINGGSGNDTLTGGDGNDSIYCDGSVPLPPNPLVPGNEPCNDKAEGGEGEDYIRGGTGNDTLFGDAGDDILCGDTNNYNSVTLFDQSTDHNYLDGGEGNDWLVGGGGDDVIIGGDGNDLLMSAYLGEDLQGLDPGFGTDQMYGGQGADLFYFHVETASDTLDGADLICDFEDGKDIISIKMQGGTKDDFIVQNEGNDCVIYLADTQQVIVKILNAAGLISEADFYVVN